MSAPLVGRFSVMEVGVMPKEVIRNASQLGTDDECHVEVRWNRDTYCQLATVKKAANYSESEQVDGWFVNLDRAGLNRLIRAARKARDQAFGADA